MDHKHYGNSNIVALLTAQTLQDAYTACVQNVVVYIQYKTIVTLTQQNRFVSQCLSK